MSGKAWGDRETAALRELGSNSMALILTERCTIGRDESNNIVVSGDPCVSRFHSVIVFEDGHYFISDSGSWNGTIVNGERVFVRRQMDHGDKIRVGLTRFEFVMGAGAEIATETSCAPAETPLSQTIFVGGRAGDPQERTHSLPESGKKPEGAEAPGGKDSISDPGAEAHIPVLPDVTLTSLEVEVPSVAHDEVPHLDGPGWCEKYFESELDELENELIELKELASEIMQRIRAAGEKIVLTHDVRNSLLLDEGDRPVFACMRIFELMGWTVTLSDTNMCEVRLALDGQTRAIAHIAFPSVSDPREALSRLVSSQIDHWCQHRVEPKGILILTEPGKDPQHHSYAGESEDLVSYAEKRNICVITVVQLLSVYREVALRHANPESFRHGLLITNGRLTGLDLEPSTVTADI